VQRTITAHSVACFASRASSRTAFRTAVSRDFCLSSFEKVATVSFLPMNRFTAQGEGQTASLDVHESRADHAVGDICGIVLAGTHHWGDGVFERVLRGPLLPVAHTPLIKYPLQWLHDAGIRSAVLCANSATPSLRAVLGDGDPAHLSLSYFEDHEPRGPAGCARDAAVMSDATTFVVIEGTIVPTLDFDALISSHRSSGAAATVVVEFDRRRRGMSSGVRRQPAGIYVFERSALTSVAQHGYQDIKEGLLGRLNASGEHVAMHEVHGLSAKVLDYSSYAAVSRWLVSRSIERPTFLPDYSRAGEGMQHPTAFVHPTARIIGPVLLAEGVRVEENAVIVGPASIGARSIVAAGAIVSRSFVWDDCVIGAGASLDSSLLADRCVVVPGDRLKNVTQLADQFSTPEPTGAAAPAIGDAVSAELLPSLDSLGTRWRNGTTPTLANGSADNDVRTTRDTATLK
jgi:NDP-sugar pyrophosphorylase family protein